MIDYIHDLHGAAANAALNARASLAQAKICINAGHAFDGLAWLELYENDFNIAAHCANKASEQERVHGSVFPGVRHDHVSL